MFCIQAPRWWCPLSFHPPPYPHPKSFIAYPTLPTTCYTIPEDTQRGNLCPGIAPNLRNSKPATQISVYKECTMRSRLHQISISRNFIIYGQWAPFPTHFPSYITPSIACKRVPFRNCARFVFETRPSPLATDNEGYCNVSRPTFRATSARFGGSR